MRYCKKNREEKSNMNDNDKTVFVNYEKRNVDSSLEEAYMELGKAYYEGKFEDPLPELLPLFDKITRMKSRQSQNVSLCPKCGNPLEEDALFCGMCGNKIR